MCRRGWWARMMKTQKSCHILQTSLPVPRVTTNLLQLTNNRLQKRQFQAWSFTVWLIFMRDLNKVCMVQPSAESPVRNFLKRRGYLGVYQNHLDQMLPFQCQMCLLCSLVGFRPETWEVDDICAFQGHHMWVCKHWSMFCAWIPRYWDGCKRATNPNAHGLVRLFIPLGEPLHWHI